MAIFRGFKTMRARSGAIFLPIDTFALKQRIENIFLLNFQSFQEQNSFFFKKKRGFVITREKEMSKWRFFVIYSCFRTFRTLGGVLFLPFS